MRTSQYILTVGITIFSTLSSAFSEEKGTNLIVNGDMEITTVSGWTVNKPGDAVCVIACVDTPTKNGKFALLLKGTGAWMSANSAQVSINSEARYRATAWIRTKKGQAHIQFDHFANGKWLGSHSDMLRTVKDEWTLVSVESDPGKYPNATHVSIGIVSDGPDVEVYVDDVVMDTVKGKAK